MSNRLRARFANRGTLGLPIPVRSAGTKATLDIDFVNNRGWNATGGNISTTLACARATPATAYYPAADGTLTSFAANTLRYGGLGLLTEEQRINLCLQSQTFDNASWTKTRSSAVADQAVAPDGTTTADFLKEDNTATNTHLATQSITITTAVYAWSVYAKANGRTWIAIDANDGSARLTYFQLTGSGTVGTNAAGNTATIDALANGWYRCKVSRTAAATGGAMTIFLATADNTNSYTGDNTSGVYVWGAQVELSAAAYLHSTYIVTTTASVTRPADVVTFSDLTWFDGTSVSLYAEWVARNVASACVWVLDAANDVTINEQTGMSPRLSDAGATFALTVGNTATAGTVVKAAGRMATNDTAFVMAGGTVVTDATATQPGTLAASRLGIDLAGANPLNGYIRRVAAWKTLLITNANLQVLTS